MKFFNKFSGRIESPLETVIISNYQKVAELLGGETANNAIAALINLSNFHPVNEKAILFTIEQTSELIDSLPSEDYDQFVSDFLTSTYGFNEQALILALHASRLLLNFNIGTYVDINGFRILSPALAMPENDYHHFIEDSEKNSSNGYTDTDVLVIDGILTIIDTTCKAESTQDIKARARTTTNTVNINAIECLASDCDQSNDINTGVTHLSIILTSCSDHLETIKTIASKATQRSRQHSRDSDDNIYMDFTVKEQL